MRDKTVSPRVLIFTTERGWGGGETQVELLLRFLPEHGFHPVLLSAAGSWIARRGARLGVERIEFEPAGAIDIRAAFRLRRLLRRGAFSLIHCQTSRAHGLALGALAGRRQRPALVVSRRTAFPSRSGLAAGLKYRRGVDLYIAISDATRSELVGKGVDPERIAVVRSGVDPDKFSCVFDPATLRREFGLESGVPVIGTVGALDGNKNQADLLRAAGPVSERFPEARFLVIGEGAQRFRLGALARELGLEDRVVFTAFREDGFALVSMLSCLVVPSLNEGLCTSIMDAHILGVPVVANSTGGIVELIEHGATGLLARPGDWRDLAGKIVTMLGDERVRARCIAGGRKMSPGYDGRETVRRTADLYRSLLSS